MFRFIYILWSPCYFISSSFFKKVLYAKIGQIFFVLCTFRKFYLLEKVQFWYMAVTVGTISLELIQLEYSFPFNFRS